MVVICHLWCYQVRAGLMIGDSPAKLAFQGASSRFLVDRRPGPFLRDFDLVLFLLGRVPYAKSCKDSSLSRPDDC